MHSGSTPRRPSKALLFKLGALAAVGLVLVALVLRGVDLKALVEQGLEMARAAGPWAFFVAMALLPAFGFPLSPFTLSAGSVFGPVMGLGWVIAAAFLAIAVNAMFSYWLARWAVRPLLEKWVVRLGYRLPEIPPQQHWEWTLLLRVAPGAPFFIQSYLLGLARVPLKIYLIVSLAVSWCYTLAFIIFGDALVQGEGRRVLGGVSLLIVVGVGLQLVRKRLKRRAAETV